MAHRATVKLDFEGWIPFVFDRPVKNPAWHFDVHFHDPIDEGHPARVVSWLTQLFENADTLLTPYSLEQVNQGLWYLAYNACSSYMFALENDAVAWADRQHAFEAMYTLFANYFAKQCAPVLSDVDESGAKPINMVCYMWWDIIPLLPRTQPMADTMLDVAQRMLSIPHDACRESALHGLGHWHHLHPHRVEALIDTFLKSNTYLRPELVAYARQARAGCVL